MRELFDDQVNLLRELFDEQVNAEHDEGHSRESAWGRAEWNDQVLGR
jgi:hypothetical protein